MAVLFDTLKLADRLEAAGMSQEQAHGTAAALAETLTGTIATAADIAAARGDIEATETRLRSEIRESELRMRSEIRDGDAALRTEIANLRAEMRGWLTTQAFAIVGAVAALIGLAAALARIIH
ncbi:MAG: coiled-coil domain-containing protein [Stellaceae bacterium]